MRKVPTPQAITKPYACDICGARCKTLAGLQGHKRFRHPRYVNDDLSLMHLEHKYELATLLKRKTDITKQVTSYLERSKPIPASLMDQDRDLTMDMLSFYLVNWLLKGAK